MPIPEWQTEYHYSSVIDDAINDKLRTRIQAYLADKIEALLTKQFGKEPEPTSYGVSAPYTGLYNTSIS